MNNTLLVVLIASGIAYGTPLLYASLGELLAERSGVLNLGVEGMMLVGAVMGFWTVQRVHTGPGIALTAGILVAAVAGAAMASIHAFLVITFRASQIVSGLALTIFAGAVGLSSYLGNDLNLSDAPARHTFHAVFPASMQRWPIIGPIVFGQDVLVYISWACVIAIWLYLSRTRPGLNVRSVGESPAAADTMGINVTAYRYAHTLVGGAFAGVAGATITLAITPQWVNGITGGAGWIAIALVIFAFWRPGALPRRRVLLRRPAGACTAAAGPSHQPRADRSVDERVAVCDDDRRARRRLVRGRPEPARGAGRAR